MIYIVTNVKPENKSYCTVASKAGVHTTVGVSVRTLRSVVRCFDEKIMLHYFLRQNGHRNENPTNPIIINGVIRAPSVSVCKRIGFLFLCSKNRTEKRHSPTVVWTEENAIRSIHPKGFASVGQFFWLRSFHLAPSKCKCVYI